MARRVLTEEQRAALLEWVAADYPASGIKQLCRERAWPVPSDRMLAYYRRDFAPAIAELRAARRESALTRGYAVKEARIAALNAHAEALESIRWIPDPKTGRLWNEKAWRETLDDIAKETGGRVQHNDITSGGQPITFLQLVQAAGAPDGE